MTLTKQDEVLHIHILVITAEIRMVLYTQYIDSVLKEV